MIGRWSGPVPFSGCGGRHLSPRIVEERISQCKAMPARKVNDPEAFSSESLPGLDPGWIQVRVKKTRQIKK
jgi:hypothetical protein